LSTENTWKIIYKSENPASAQETGLIEWFL